MSKVAFIFASSISLLGFSISLSLVVESMISAYSSLFRNIVIMRLPVS